MKTVCLAAIVALSLLLGDSGTAAGLGWYLMAPPPGSAADGADIPFLTERVPLRRWQNLRAFDSAAACETYRSEEIDQATRDAKQVTQQSGDASDPMAKLLADLSKFRFWQSTFSRCIAADDPRLAR